MEWREMLADIFRRQAAAAKRAGGSDSEAAVTRFLETTVAPAFEALKSEFAGHGREVRIKRSPGAVSLTVLDAQGREEFFYAVQAQRYRRMSFAFPELDLSEADRPAQVRAEVTLRSGPTAFDVTGYTQDQVIRHFLHEYRKWIGWRHGGPPQP
jgi:hypothetical protein